MTPRTPPPLEAVVLSKLGDCWNRSLEQWVDRPVETVGVALCVAGILVVFFATAVLLLELTGRGSRTPVGADVSAAGLRIARLLRRRQYLRALAQLGRIWDATAPLRRRATTIRVAKTATGALVVIALGCVKPELLEFVLRLIGCLLAAGGSAAGSAALQPSCHVWALCGHLGMKKAPKVGVDTSVLTDRTAPEERP